MNRPSPHLSDEQLLAYWLHETDPDQAEAADEHLMRCDACGERLDELIALGRGVRDAFRAGQVSAGSSGAFVQRLVEQGLAVREYRLPPNGSVQCTAAPQDDVLVCRLEAPLEGVERLDVIAESTLEPGQQRRLPDIAFDAGAREVVWVENLARIRQLPAHTAWVTLVATGPEGERRLGRYAFQHTPWAQAGG